MSPTESTIFAILFTTAVFAFALSVGRIVRAIRLGGPDARVRGAWEQRIVALLEYGFAQKRVLAERFGRNHFFLFWGFMVLFLDNAGFVVNGLFPAFHLSMVGPIFFPILTLLFDLMPMLVMACVIVALHRRLVTRPDHIDYRSVDAFVILGLVFFLMFLFYGYHGAEIGLGQAQPLTFMPFTRIFVVPLMKATFGDSLHTAGRVFWWLHALVFLGFLNYLPFSKHLHILTALPACFSRSFFPVTTVPRETFAAGNRYGSERVDQFSWKDLLDFTACTECGRCNQNCPATNTGKPLNPRLVIHDGKVNLFANATRLAAGNRSQGILPLIREKDATAEGSVGEDALWDCTTCGACMAVCPVFIEHVPKIIQMRRHLVENLAKFPPELGAFFASVEQRSNPWALPPADRARWAKDLDLRVLSDLPEEEHVEFLFFVGCAGSFDSRAKKVAVALARTFKAAGLSFGILGAEEHCCGDSLRRLGNEFVFDRMAEDNVALFQQRGVRNIVCYCPHCYSTLKNDYAQYGLNARVFHYTEVLQDLLGKGKLKLDGAASAGRLVFHDSCYLGRHNGVYQQPRQLLRAASGEAPLEMDRKMEKGFCCGAGGGRMWMEEDPEHRVNLDRVREALEQKPDTLAVSCPYCMTMFEDGVKDLGVNREVKVVDVAELLAAQLPGATPLAHTQTGTRSSDTES